MKQFKPNVFTPAVTHALMLSVIIGISAVSVHAGEFTAKADKFEQIIKLQATAMPVTGEAISIKPAVWNTIKIETFLPHGSQVKKGEKLLVVNMEAIDDKITEMTHEREKQKLVLESAELELESLRSSTAESLAKAKREYEHFLEDYAYYKKVTKPQKASDTEYTVKRANDYLSYEQEELDQLLKMYEADGLTEETEEIIIKRAKHGLTSAKRNLAKAEREAGYEKTIVTSRNDVEWAVSAETKKRAWELTKKNLPLALKIKEQDVAKLKRDEAKFEQQLRDLKADRVLMEFHSPVDGVVYFGEFKDGKWMNEAAKKAIVVGGSVPINATFMTIVPADAKLRFNAFLTEIQQRLLKPEMNGILRLKSNPWQSTPVKLELASESPSLTHHWLVSFVPTANLPSSATVGSKADISIVVFSDDDVLSVPVNAVKSNPDGSFTVQIKMAEGEPQITEVKLGRQAGDKIEVLSGLENGQVILTP